MLHPEPRGRLVDEVDRLVRQLATGDVAVGQGRGGDQRGIGDADAVVRLVLLLDAAQDLDGVLDRGLADVDLLEAALERGVLLDALAVLVERRRADHVQLAAGQHRLEHVAGVHRGVAAGACPDDGVQLVDEGDHLTAGVLDLLEDGLEPLLELAAVLRAGHHRGQVERQHATTLERVGDVAGDHPLGEALDDRRLADARLTDQDGVVLRAPRQHLHDAPDLRVTTDDGVEPAVLGLPGQVDGVLLQRLVRRLGGLAGHPTVAADGRDRLAQPGRGESRVGQHLLRRRLDGRERDEQVVGGDVVVLHRSGEVDRGRQHARQGGRGAGLLDRRPRGAGERPLDGHRRGQQVAGVDPGLRHHAPAGAVLLLEQRDEQVDRLGVGVAAGGGGELGGLDHPPAAGGELLGTELAQRCSSLARARPRGATVVPLGATRHTLSRFPSTLGSLPGRRRLYFSPV